MLQVKGDSEGALAEMVTSFGVNNGATLGEVYKAFAKERESGLLLHYWP